MVAIKAHQAAAFLKSPDSRLCGFLFFGSDAGLIGERAHGLAARLAASSTPPGEIVRIDDSDLDADPARLEVELQTIAMFAGRKIVRVAAGRRVTAATLKPLIDSGLLTGVLIVEAGNLKPDDALRALFEKAPQAAAIACYADAPADLDAVVREVLQAAHLTIGTEARQLLVARLGADRAMSRAEIEKLALYAAGKGEISIDDVDAIVGDASELAIDRILDAAAAGDAAAAVTGSARAIASGENAQAIIAAAQRHFHRLHRIRAAVDGGQGIDDALRQLRPPLHFKRKDAFAAQVRSWRANRLAAASSAIRQSAAAARLSTSLEDAILERLLVGLAQMAGRSGTGRSAGS